MSTIIEDLRVNVRNSPRIQGALGRLHSGRQAKTTMPAGMELATTEPVATKSKAREPRPVREVDTTSRWGRHVAWRRGRPFVGSILTMIAGVELFFSGQLDLGNIKVQVGIEGLQSTIIPIGMVLLGLLALLMPAHRIFYGVLALVLAVYTLVGLNLGGFFLGMLLGAIGGILVVAWMPKPVAATTTGSDDAAEFHDDAAPAEPRPLVLSRS